MILLAAMAMSAAQVQVTTNEALYRQFRDWEKAIRAGEAKEGFIPRREVVGICQLKRELCELEAIGVLKYC